MMVPAVSTEREEHMTVVTVAPTKGASVVATLDSGGQRRGGRLGVTPWLPHQTGDVYVAGPAAR
jgi:hypothetical protein